MLAYKKDGRRDRQTDRQNLDRSFGVFGLSFLLMDVLLLNEYFRHAFCIADGAFFFVFSFDLAARFV